MSDSEMTSDAPETNEVMESLGEPQNASANINNAGTLDGKSNNTVSDEDPLYVQKRLKRQAREHEREMKSMQSQIAMMQSQLQSNPQMSADQSGQSDDPIQRAVTLALQQRDLQEQKQRQAESAAHVQKNYSELNKHLDAMEDKYDDFKDTVLGNDKPFTTSMRDYALTLPKKGGGSAGEVLYHLGKNPDELKRISKLEKEVKELKKVKPIVNVYKNNLPNN